jgi:hypothetical protein
VELRMSSSLGKPWWKAATEPLHFLPERAASGSFVTGPEKYKVLTVALYGKMLGLS